MSKASNQSKRLKKIKARNLRRRLDSANKSKLPKSTKSKTINNGASANPLVRGSLQRVLTRLPNGRSTISEISREATAGGVIYRLSNEGELEILLVADHFNRWTIPKGHIEEGETAQETAIREIGEEAGVHQLEPICWLGKIHFRYRRENILVLMSTQIYLFKALGDTNDIQKEDWMTGIKWYPYDEAVNIIAYKDIAKLMRLGRRRLIQKGKINDKED